MMKWGNKTHAEEMKDVDIEDEEKGTGKKRGKKKKCTGHPILCRFL